MATRDPSNRYDSAKNVAIDVMRKAGEPLHVKEITKRVLASGRCAGLKGKTPDATLAAMLAVGSKPGGPFTRTDKATYTLAADSTTVERAKGEATAEPRSRRKPGVTTEPVQ